VEPRIAASKPNAVKEPALAVSVMVQIIVFSGWGRIQAVSITNTRRHRLLGWNEK
jgi:hypothetical protein